MMIEMNFLGVNQEYEQPSQVLHAQAYEPFLCDHGVLADHAQDLQPSCDQQLNSLEQHDILYLGHPAKHVSLFFA